MTVPVPNITQSLIPKKKHQRNRLYSVFAAATWKPCMVWFPLTFRRNLSQTNHQNLLINLPVLGIGTSFD